MKKMLLRVPALLLALVLIVSLCSCSPSRKLHASTRATRAVARAGEIEIPYERLYYVAMNRIAEMKATYGEDVFSDPARVQELEDFVRANLLTKSEVLMEIGQEYGLDVERGEIADSVQEDMDRILEESFAGDRKAYIESLNAAYLTDHYVRTYIGVEEYLASAILLEMLDRNELDYSDESARAHLNGEHFIRVRQVLIETRNYASKEAALARATELRNGVAAESDETERVIAMKKAIQYSTDLDVDGEGLYFARGEMTPEYEAAAFALPLYGVSEVLEIDGNYCFMMHMPKDGAYIEEHFEELKQKTYYIQLNDRIDRRMATITLEMTKYGASLDLLDLPPIDANGGAFLHVIKIVAIALASVAAVVVTIVLVRRHKPAGKGKKRAKK